MKRILIPFVALCFYTLVYAIATGVLLPTGDGTIGSGVTDFASGTTDLWDEINEDPDSSPVDSDGIEGPNNSGSSSFFLMADMPGDFVTMTSLNGEIRCALRDDPPTGPDNWDIRVHVTESDEGTPLTALPSVQPITDDQTFRNYEFTFTGVVAGDKTTWDGARMNVTMVWDQFKGMDGNAIRCSAMKMSGEYSNVAGTRSRVINIL